MWTTKKVAFRAALLGTTMAIGCAQSQAAQKANEDARTKGQYKVRLTTNGESVAGDCKYVSLIQPDQDPVAPVPEPQLADYFRTQAVLKGADTVVVRGRVGEAYICGPTPLNPDGTPRTQYDTPPQ